MHSCKKTLFWSIAQRGTLVCSLILSFAFSKNCYAQTTDCDQTLMTEIDSLSQELIVHAQKNIIVSEDGGKTGFALYGAYVHETVTLAIHTVGAGACVNEGDSVQFVFTDSAKLGLANMAKFNCQARSSIHFNATLNNTNQLQLLAEKQIAQITVWTKTKSLTRNVSDPSSADIRKLFSCLGAVLGRQTKLVGDKIFTVVEQQPEFQGGYETMMDFLKKNLRYPADARRRGIHGTVYVSFIIGKDGSITEVKVIRGVSADVDQEAIRVVSMMPPWRPGMQNGKPVYVRFILPVKFK